jgi:hypothetical protein
MAYFVVIRLRLLLLLGDARCVFIGEIAPHLGGMRRSQ